jgi:transposase-like protein
MAKRRRDESPERQALREMMNGYLKENPVKNGTDVNGLMREMMSVILEGSLDGEMEEELGYSKYDFRNKETDNSRNGYNSKTLHTSYGDMELDVPRDRNGEFEPKIIKKYQNTLTQDMEEKIISMYAKGMTTGDIESHMQELYGVEISDSTISRITDKILPIVKECPRGQTLARTPSRRDLCRSVHGCNPFSCQKRRSNRKKGCLYRHWHRYERT